MYPFAAQPLAHHAGSVEWAVCADMVRVDCQGECVMDLRDREVLRRLATRWMQLASLPAMAERNRQWTV